MNGKWPYLIISIFMGKKQIKSRYYFFLYAVLNNVSIAYTFVDSEGWLYWNHSSADLNELRMWLPQSQAAALLWPKSFVGNIFSFMSKFIFVFHCQRASLSHVNSIIFLWEVRRYWWLPFLLPWSPNKNKNKKANKSPEQVIQNKYCTNGRSTKEGQEYEKRIDNVKSSIECNALDKQTTDKEK